MYKSFIKRLLDIFICIVFMPIILFVILLFSILIIITDGRPVFYNSYRIGRYGKRFKMFKLRSMKNNSPDIRNKDGSTFNSENDFRVTRIGNIMRKTSIDELPQFINVLIGDMSIIGPRPTISEIEIDLNDLDNIKKKHYLVRPGITGYSQAFYRNSISQEQKYLYDEYYVDNLSFVLDVRIFVKTIKSVIKQNNIFVTENSNR